MVLDCRTETENYTAVVKRYKPKKLILIDAADMSLTAGDIRIIPKEKLGRMHISTHGMPLSVLITYLEHEADHNYGHRDTSQAYVWYLERYSKKSGNHLIDIMKKKKYEQIPVL